MYSSLQHITIICAVARALEYCQDYTGTAIKYNVSTEAATKLAQSIALYGNCHYIDPTFRLQLSSREKLTNYITLYNSFFLPRSTHTLKLL